MQPTGPMPAAVYWRRRAVALAGLVLLLLLLIWLVATVAGGAPEPARQPTQSAAQQLPPRSSSTGRATSTATPSPTVTAGRSGQAPSGTTAAPPSSPAAPQPCPDKIIGVAAAAEQPEYRVGAKPVFRLTVTNTGAVPCIRDLNAALQELLVYAADGTTRLWSSNDCYPGESANVRTLAAGESVAFTVTWAGRSSHPECAGERVQVPAGDYLVVAKLGPLTSQPAPFKLLP
jgi:hypothetical protein